MSDVPSDADAGIWLRISSMLRKNFKKVAAFEADSDANLDALSDAIAAIGNEWAKLAVIEADKKNEEARQRRRLRRFDNALDAYDYETRLNERKRRRQSLGWSR